MSNRSIRNQFIKLVVLLSVTSLSVARLISHRVHHPLGQSSFVHSASALFSIESEAGPIAPKSNAAEQAENTLVVGGGIAGLATAAALRNIAGVQNVRVLEATSEAAFLNPKAGAAAQLGPNGLRALGLISGVGEEAVNQLVDMGNKVEGNIFLLPGGKEMAMPDTTQDDTGLPQILVRWGMLRSLLANMLPEGVVTTSAGEEIAGYKVHPQTSGDGESKKNTLDIIDGSGNCLYGDIDLPSPPLIVGADGVRSTFRALVRSSTTHLASDAIDIHEARGEDVKYGGRINIKAVVDTKLGDDFKSGQTYAHFAPDGSVAVFAGPAGEGATYWAISVADQKDGETGKSETFLDDILATDDTDLLKGNIKTKLLAKLDVPDSGLFVRSVVDLIKQTDAADLLFQKSEEAKELGLHPLHSADGCVVLVGDAAHAMSASYGQAANFALEDAATLATCVRDSDDLAKALEVYSKKRLGRCKEMQTRSAERAAKAMKGEQVEDVSKWIFLWDIE